MSEQRLIDANRIIDFIDCGHLRNPLELCFSESEVVNMLEQAPTVPAEVVVHCINCKYKSVQGCVEDTIICEKLQHFYSVNHACNEGERREDGKT